MQAGKLDAWVAFVHGCERGRQAHAHCRAFLDEKTVRNLRQHSASIAQLGVGALRAAVIEIGDFRVDTAAHKVTVRRCEVRLTPKEFDLLVFLVRRPGKVVNHRTLLGAIWGGQSTEQVEYLRVFVGQLRKKLEPDASSPRYIVTEPWVGYRFEPGE